MFKYEKYGIAPYEGSNGFTVIEMEKLIPLSAKESEKYNEWIVQYIECRRNGNLSSDDFNLLKVIDALFEYAAQNMQSIRGIDLCKSTNVMKRDNGEFVVIDPFN